MNAMYGPQEATGNDVGEAEAAVVDAELDLAYTEASRRRGLERAAEVYGPQLPTTADLDAARDRVAPLLTSGSWGQFVAAETAYEDTFSAWASSAPQQDREAGS